MSTDIFVKETPSMNLKVRTYAGPMGMVLRLHMYKPEEAVDLNRFMDLNVREALQLYHALDMQYGGMRLTESSRQMVICAVAADLYNENGDMEGTKISSKDLDDFCTYYAERATAMDIRKPSRFEISQALFHVMGATYDVDGAM